MNEIILVNFFKIIFLVFGRCDSNPMWKTFSFCLCLIIGEFLLIKFLTNLSLFLTEFWTVLRRLHVYKIMINNLIFCWIDIKRIEMMLPEVWEIVKRRRSGKFFIDLKWIWGLFDFGIWFFKRVFLWIIDFKLLKNDMSLFRFVVFPILAFW